ncbi:unnamed protein product [Ilex paraguariensis]|uniref:Uncharacterized protein n=1 Tax=Ilex paraguariensis TaxID=185542 RepID=A0ABC8SN40_9AQUA
MLSSILHLLAQMGLRDLTFHFQKRHLVITSCALQGKIWTDFHQSRFNMNRILLRVTYVQEQQSTIPLHLQKDNLSFVSKWLLIKSFYAFYAFCFFPLSSFCFVFFFLEV